MMRPLLASVCGLALLSACGDPLDRVDSLADIELADQQAVTALPTEAELARSGGFLSRFRGPPNDAAQADAAATAVPEDAVSAAAAAAAVPEDAVSAAAAPVPVDAAALVSEGSAAPVVEAPTPDSTVLTAVTEAEAAPEKPRSTSGRVISWLTRQAPKARTPDVPAVTGDVVAGDVSLEVAAVDATSDATAQDATTNVTAVITEAGPTPTVSKPSEPVRLASLAPEATAPKVIAPDVPLRAQPKAEPKRRGLFRRADKPSRPLRKGVSLDAPYGAVLPFGKVARVCDARSQPLGQKVAQSEGRGQVYSLYDSAPGATAPRAFFVTGFDDKCPRQFTAALALFGAPSMHEKLRYGRPAASYPYSATDQAYEEIKADVCGAPKGRPCGPKIDMLERDTIFISTYEKFTDNGRWADLLINDGAVVATALKAP